jgi:predicted nucleotidyltransferase
MLKKEYQILEEFVKKPWKKFTFKEVKKISGKKSESYVYSSLKKFVKFNTLKEERVGNVILYSLNLFLHKTLTYASFVLEHISWNKKYVPYKDLEKIASKIPTKFFTFIIAGSYANNTQKKTSDIDVVILCDNTFETKRIYAELKQDCELNIPLIHLYVFKNSEFLEMLLNKEANYGKEIANKNIILYGGENYFNIISEAIKNGFTG